MPNISTWKFFRPIGWRVVCAGDSLIVTSSAGRDIPPRDVHVSAEAILPTLGALTWASTKHPGIRKCQSPSVLASCNLTAHSRQGKGYAGYSSSFSVRQPLGHCAVSCNRRNSRNILARSTCTVQDLIARKQGLPSNPGYLSILTVSLGRCIGHGGSGPGLFACGLGFNVFVRYRHSYERSHYQRVVQAASLEAPCGAPGGTNGGAYSQSSSQRMREEC